MNSENIVLETPEKTQTDVVELNELQLAMIGGGAGENILA